MTIDESTGERLSIRYRKENLYLIVFEETQEVFISSVKHDDGLTVAGMDAIARLFSIAWQNVGLEKALKQLDKASNCTSDFPGILHNELKAWL